jgi:5-methyltetrahydrofolate--homocysteine methyltransferase
MGTTLLERIAAGLLPSDGAIGTELQKRGLEPGAFGELWNVECPGRVEDVHSAYRDAGAEFFTTNSFRSNRISLAGHGMGERALEFSRRAAEIARAAAGPDRWVGGSMGPFGGFLEPLGDASEADVLAAFTEQARGLLEGGADAIVVETMSSLEEATLAVRAARDAGARVVVALMTFDRGAGGCRTMMGTRPADAARTLREKGADIVGTNCGTGLTIEDYAAIVREMAGVVDCPIEVRPNAGNPELVDGKVIYRQEPAAMAAEIRVLADAGARIIGGCCGTTPEHIRAFREPLRAAGIR